jgi:peptidoglycan lytic transglycosylase
MTPRIRKLGFKDNMKVMTAALLGRTISLGLIGSAEAQSGDRFGLLGEKTANGEFAFPNRLTAAHKTLPLGARVKVTNNKNGKSVVVRINDRGPYVTGRIIDLTPAGARALAMDGLAQVEVRRIS